MAHSKSQLAQVHYFEWYGRNGMTATESVSNYGIAVRCIPSKGISLKNSDYDCYVPDPDDDDCCIRFRVSNDLLIQAVRSQIDLAYFLRDNGFFFSDFIAMDISDKLYYACNYYDVIPLLGLTDPLTYFREDIQLKH